MAAFLNASKDVRAAGSLPQVFNFDALSIRTFNKDGEVWFAAADVCAALDITNPRNATARLDDDEKGVHTVDTSTGKKDIVIINESGLYSIILTSRKESAKRFKKWVTSEVLPAIRKSGGYTTAEEVTHQVKDAFRFGRWLMHFDSRGNVVMNPVQMGAVVINPQDIAGLSLLIGEHVPFELIPEILRLANERVLKCYQANATKGFA